VDQQREGGIRLAEGAPQVGGRILTYAMNLSLSTLVEHAGGRATELLPIPF
jgi:hypothetical protein